jgi:hypothetical protein
MTALNNTTYFRYLDLLRASGKLNMFAAPGVLAEAFSLNKKEAIDIWVAWTKQYGKENINV